MWSATCKASVRAQPKLCVWRAELQFLFGVFLTFLGATRGNPFNRERLLIFVNIQDKLFAKFPKIVTMSMFSFSLKRSERRVLY